MRRWWTRPNPTPKVSVVIATYNWSRVLRHAITSVLAQTFSDFELLVVGDGCTDDSGDVVASFADPRIRWHNLPQNFGNQSAPNNAGLELARGEYVAYLGHDDLWLPEHLQALVAALDETAADFAFSLASLIIPGDGRWLSGLLDGPFGARDFVVPSSLMHRLDAARRIGPWPDYREVQMPPDVEWQQRALACGLRFAAVPRLTVVKFPSAVRRDSYVHCNDDEQVQWLRRIREEADLERHELTDLLRRAARGELTRVAVPDHVFVPAGWYIRRARVVRGLDVGERLEMQPVTPPIDATAVPIVVTLAPPVMTPHGRARIEVVLENRCTHLLASLPPNPVHLSYRWLDESARVLPVEGRRSVLPEPLGPGTRLPCVMEVIAPGAPGRYRLRLAVVQERVRWLEEPASALPELDVEVRGA